MINELKNGKADRDKVGTLEKKVTENAIKIEELQNLIAQLQKILAEISAKSGDKKIEFSAMPTTGVSNEALNALKDEIENLKR